MKRAALLSLIVLLAPLANAQDTPSATDTTATTVAPAVPQDSALVRTARESKAKKKLSKRKVITNADVKKARGKIAVTAKTAAPAETATTSEAAPKGELQIQDERLRSRRDAATQVDTLEKRVAQLERDLNRIEQSFYEENDPNVRDEVIRKRFDQTRKQLDDARKELADSRDALAAIDKKQ